MAGSGKFTSLNKKATKKLTAEKVRDIRELYARSMATQGQLARDFGVSIVTIARVIHKESWQDVPDRDMPTAPVSTPEEIAKRALGVQRLVDGVNADEVLEELDKGSQLE